MKKLFSGLSLCTFLLSAAVSYALTANWTGSPDADGYRLYRAQGLCVSAGTFAIIETYGAVTTGVVPTPVANGTYCYKLTAYNLAGESPFSNTIEVKSVVVPPVAPSNLTVKP